MEEQPIDQFYKALSPAERAQIVADAAQAFGNFLTALKVDWQGDPQTKETPLRVAKMYVDELFAGRFSTLPDLQSFEGKASGELVVNGPIMFRSLCAHHCLPMTGFVTIGLVPARTSDGKSQLLGLSKYVRLVNWCSSRGYMQEDLGHVILNTLQAQTQSEKIAVFIGAAHQCCTHRGVHARENRAVTLHMTPAFEQDAVLRNDFGFITAAHMQQTEK